MRVIGPESASPSSDHRSPTFLNAPCILAVTLARPSPMDPMLPKPKPATSSPPLPSEAPPTTGTAAALASRLPASVGAATSDAICPDCTTVTAFLASTTPPLASADESRNALSFSRNCFGSSRISRRASGSKLQRTPASAAQSKPARVRSSGSSRGRRRAIIISLAASPSALSRCVKNSPGLRIASSSCLASVMASSAATTSAHARP
mmetsp:Transcript_47921/g.125467  ORF Transcript_47921/g.125467 Transcript_47921/m.125467 type:complete len:207 (-) Transcript_47921:135-755(-)